MSIAAYHPNIVHFVIALLVVGVLLRLVSLSGRFSFTNAAATTLILLGTAAAILAAVSGEQAHGPVERIPGVRDAVEEHEQWGGWTRNIFMVASLIEIAVIVLITAQQRFARHAAIVSAVVGVIGLGVLYEAASHGGELVYSYAGGVGIRSGEAADVNRVAIAGAYHQANQDRQTGNAQASTPLVDAIARRFPDNVEVQLFAIDWQIGVKQDAAGAVQRLDALPIAQAAPRIRVRAGMLRANALVAQGNVEGARAVLRTLLAENPGNAQVQRSLDELNKTK
jgi:uncharacterized membrane protein